LARFLVLLSALVLVLGVGSAGAQTSSFSIRTSATFQRLGTWRIDRDPTLRGATEALGPPTACRTIRHATHGRASWRSLGVSIDLLTYGGLPEGRNACSAPARIHVNWVRVTGTRWVTSRGLRVGDPVAKLRRLYPHARANLRENWPRGYWLVSRRTACIGICSTPFVCVPQLLAETRDGRTIAFFLHVGAQGD
jgi:hypothetical protein